MDPLLYTAQLEDRKAGSAKPVMEETVHISSSDSDSDDGMPTQRPSTSFRVSQQHHSASQSSNLGTPIKSRNNNNNASDAFTTPTRPGPAINPAVSFGSTATTVASTQVGESPIAPVSTAMVVTPPLDREGSVGRVVPPPDLSLRGSAALNGGAVVALQEEEDDDEEVVEPGGSFTSHLSWHIANGKRHQPAQLYDREKELGILRDEYATMVKRAKGAVTERVLRQRNLTSVLCIAGKAGTGKTALIESFVQQELAAPPSSSASSSSSSGSTPPVSYFLTGKFDWPTSSTTSTMRAIPSVGRDIMDSSQFKPALADGTREEQQQHEPFAAFGQVLEHLLQQIQASGPVAADKARERILKAMGPTSIPVLAELDPKWSTFLEQNSFDEHDEEDEEDNGKPQDQPSSQQEDRPPPFITTTNSTTAVAAAATGTRGSAPKPNTRTTRVDNRIPRLKYVLRQLFRAVTDMRNPCVLILDDAQWADQESLELARYLHADLENPYFMLIITWRTNDIHEEESCYTAMGSSIGVFANDLVRRINLAHLSPEGVTSLVAEALQMRGTDVTGLSKVVHAKTSGNPFFCRQLLEFLEREAFLKWRPSRLLWRWDEVKIADLHTSGSFLDLVTAQLQYLPDRCQVALQVLSCLGQAFEEDSACVILEKMDTVEIFGVEITHTDAMGCLDYLERAGFLKRQGAGITGGVSYNLRTTFAHDQIQEAAFHLIPRESRSLLQLRIGERLLEIMEEQRSENISFLGIDLCTKGIGFLSSKERMGLALYNLVAGEKCMARASFHSALSYFEFGLSALRVNDFLKGRLSLELSFGAMEAAFCVDDADKVMVHYDRITGSGSTSDDKIRAHVLLIRATGARGNPGEALATGFRVLKSMNIKTITDVSNKVSVLVHLAKTRMALRKHTEQTLSNMREMNGTKLCQAMCIVEAMLPFAYTHDRKLFVNLVMKAVRWSLKYGVTGQTPMLFAALGSFPAFQSADMKASVALGVAALRLMQRFGARDYPGMVMFLVHSQILTWTVEPQIVKKHLEATYRVSFESGDVLSAFCSLAGAYAIAFESGHTKLGELEVSGETFSHRMKENGYATIAAAHDATWQVVLSLREHGSSTTSLTGRHANNNDELLLAAACAGNEIVEFAILSRQFQYSYLMGERERAETYRQKCEPLVGKMASTPHLITHVAYGALNCLSLCASHSPDVKSTNFKMALRYYRKLKHWQEDQGYKFCEHLVRLVQAELARVEAGYPRAEKYYQSAIWSAGKLGNIRDKALAHELAGRFFLRDRKDEIWAANHFDNAMQGYHSWGATALVNKVMENHGDIVSRDAKRSNLSSQLLAEQSHDSSVV